MWERAEASRAVLGGHVGSARDVAMSLNELMGHKPLGSLCPQPVPCPLTADLAHHSTPKTDARDNNGEDMRGRWWGRELTSQAS